MSWLTELLTSLDVTKCKSHTRTQRC